MATTTYLWDPVSDNVLTEETDGTTTTYTQKPGLYGNLVSQRTNGASARFYHFDAIGNTRELTNDAETTTDTRTYDAWGNTVHSTGAMATPFRFVGRNGYQRDAKMQTDYVRARFFSASLGLWLTKDDNDAWKNEGTYRYALNNPVRHTDPSGQATSLECSLVHTGSLFKCFYGDILVSPVVPTDFGVKVALHFDASLQSELVPDCCPTCDDYRWIQVVVTNWPKPYFLTPDKEIPKRVFIDNGTPGDREDTFEYPWYAGHKGPPNPAPVEFPPATFDPPKTDASMYDGPERKSNGYNGPNGEYIPDGSLRWEAISCAICHRHGKVDIVMGCVTWGFTRRRLQKGAGRNTFGTPQPIAPRCLENGGGYLNPTQSLMALACSPKSDPCVMRVLSTKKVKETRDDEEASSASHAGTDREEAS